MFLEWKPQYSKHVNCYQMINTVNTIWIKIPARVLIDINKLVLKFTWKKEETRIARIILKKNKIGGITLPHYKTYYI